MTLKQKVFLHYLQLIQTKIDLLQQVTADLKESGANETKSTAGDKHETALAMLQIEQANTRRFLKDAFEQKVAFEKINPNISSEKIITGSLIKTNFGWLFLSLALGKATIDNTKVIALSAQSPLGIKLLGRVVADSVIMNNQSYIIEAIY